MNKPFGAKLSGDDMPLSCTRSLERPLRDTRIYTDEEVIERARQMGHEAAQRSAKQQHSDNREVV